MPLRLLLTVDPEIPVPPKFYGGIERVVDTLIRELRTRGHIVGLAANPDSTCKVDFFVGWPGKTSHRKADSLRNTIALLRTVNTFRPDIVHNFARLGYLLPLLPRSIPKIMSYQRGVGGRQISMAGKLAGKSVVFTACSEFVASQGRAWGSRWTAIHNFVNTDYYRFQRTVEENAPLVFLSRIERIKGVHAAITIARRTGRKLIIAGTQVDHEEGRAYWRSQVEPFLDGEEVEYQGPVNDEQKNALLGQAAALIVPIEWDEPFGIVFAEALACGTPVISCPRGALPEIISSGKHGFLIRSLEEGIVAVQRLGTIKRADCRRRAEESFSHTVIANKYEALYSSMTMNGRTETPCHGLDLMNAPGSETTLGS